MKPQHSDSDWLEGSGPTTLRERNEATLELNPGVYVRESPEGEALPCASLSRVLVDTQPWGPESTIEDAIGRVLAHVDESRAQWICTVLGRVRVESEIAGAA